LGGVGVRLPVALGRLPRVTAAQVLGDRYELVDPLGFGGMSVVWRAHDRVLDRFVAVKLLAGRLAGEAEARDRIRTEARAAAALSHPNVAQVYDYGEWQDAGRSLPFVVMELIRGTSLQQRVEAGPMSARFAMRTAAEVAAALAEAHAEGLVHRDVKPANVMLTPQGAKVVDFGIAAAIRAGGTGQPIEELFGTPAYVAPERLTDDAVAPASDVYALGVLLYRLLSGESPWTVETTTEMLAAHVYIEPVPLAQLPGVPDYITELCNRCLAKDPTERPTAREAASLLAHAAGMRVVADDQPAAATAGSGDERSVLIRRTEIEDVLALPLKTGARGPEMAGRPAAAEEQAAGMPAAAEPRQPAEGQQAEGQQAAHEAWPSDGQHLAERPEETAGPDQTTGPEGAAPAVRAHQPGAVGAREPAIGVEARAARREKAAARRRRRLWVFAGVIAVLAAGLYFVLPDDPPGRGDAAVVTDPGGSSAAPSGRLPENAAGAAGPRTRPGPGEPPVPGAPDPATGAIGTAGDAGGIGFGTPTVAAGPDRTTGGAQATPTVTITPDQPGSTTTGPAEPEERTLSSAGGTVRAVCPSAGTAKLVSWSATRPFRVEEVSAGPAAEAVAVFRRGSRQVRMTVTCAAGVPSSSNAEL